MKSSAVILFMIVFNVALFAQAPNIQWTKTFGDSGVDWGNSVQQTTDGGYIITGHKGTAGWKGDVWLIKTDFNGDTVWTKTFGDTFDDIGNSVQQTRDGGYIMVGYSETLGAGGIDVLLIRTDASGDTMWTKTFGDSGFDWGNSVDTTFDGGYIITGVRNIKSFSSAGIQGGDVWLIKTDANGDTMWTKTFGDSMTDWGNSVQQTTDGGYIITGVTRYRSGIKFWSGDIWLIKTDANGDTVWTSIYGERGFDWGNSVQQTVDGGYIIAGTELIKTDANGDTLWTKAHGGNSVQQTSDGGYIITGGGVILSKIDPNGQILWTKTIGGSSGDRGYSVQQTTDGGFIITGSTNYDVWLIKMAPDITSIEESPHASIKDYRLIQNFPNPFNPTTNIEFSIPKSEFVTLKVYNILGEEVARVVSERLNAGKYSYEWDASRLASGVYLCRLTAGDYTRVRKMILMK